MNCYGKMNWLIGIAVIVVATACGAGEVIPLPRAHAHNDYRHERPLFDALDHGFCSVEADIFLVEGQLLIGHFSSRYKDYDQLEEEARAIFKHTNGVKDGEVYSLPLERVSTE